MAAQLCSPSPLLSSPLLLSKSRRSQVPTGLLPISLSAGRSHTCTTNFNNAVQCFGDSTGYGSTPSARFAGTAAAMNVTCGIPLDEPVVVGWIGGGGGGGGA